LFCLLTMNHHPIHLDAEYARKQHHGQILVVGTLVISVAVGLSVRDISGKAIANLKYQDIIHDAPVFLNDTIYAETEVIDKKISKSNKFRGMVDIELRAYNQRKQKVLTLKRKILVPRKRV
jgi:acyl dehydratase